MYAHGVRVYGVRLADIWPITTSLCLIFQFVVVKLLNYTEAKHAQTVYLVVQELIELIFVVGTKLKLGHQGRGTQQSRDQ